MMTRSKTRARLPQTPPANAKAFFNAWGFSAQILPEDFSAYGKAVDAYELMTETAWEIGVAQADLSDKLTEARAEGAGSDERNPSSAEGDIALSPLELPAAAAAAAPAAAARSFVELAATREREERRSFVEGSAQKRARPESFVDAEAERAARQHPSQRGM